MATLKYRDQFNKDFFEKAAWQKSRLVCGIDEVGRGCLAGPVVTAAAILFPNKKSRLIKDSKLMSQKEIQLAYKWIVKNAWVSYGILGNREIDKYNIYYATLRAMKRTVMQLFSHCDRLPHKILVDAMPLNLAETAYEHIDVIHFPFGESKSSSIAAASIVAKIHRDAIMRKLDSVFPAYQFAKHKGYGTKIHQGALQQKGHSIIHRMRFLTNKPWLDDKQLRLPFNNQTEQKD